MSEKYDVVIVGAGPAGMTSGLYSARNALKTAIVSKDIGGTTNSILVLENWPGFKGSGSELMMKFYNQLKEYNVEFIMEDVVDIKKSENKFLIKTSKKEISAKSVILSTGTERKKLFIPGEDEFVGKGVSYCVTCDAFFFKDKIAGVVGGSDCAAVSALALSDLAKKVYVIYRGKKLKCENVTSDKLEKKENVEIIYNATPIEIFGKENVEGLKIKNKEKNQEREIKLDGIFIEIGATPLAKCVKDLGIKINEEGYIIVNQNMKTSVEGIFAAGDVTNHPLKQVVVASAQGAIAAKSVYDFLQDSELL